MVWNTCALNWGSRVLSVPADAHAIALVTQNVHSFATKSKTQIVEIMRGKLWKIAQDTCKWRLFTTLSQKQMVKKIAQLSCFSSILLLKKFAHDTHFLNFCHKSRQHRKNRPQQFCFSIELHNYRDFGFLPEVNIRSLKVNLARAYQSHICSQVSQKFNGEKIIENFEFS